MLVGWSAQTWRLSACSMVCYCTYKQQCYLKAYVIHCSSAASSPRRYFVVRMIKLARSNLSARPFLAHARSALAINAPRKPSRISNDNYYSSHGNGCRFSLNVIWPVQLLKRETIPVSMMVVFARNAGLIARTFFEVRFQVRN